MWTVNGRVAKSALCAALWRTRLGTAYAVVVVVLATLSVLAEAPAASASASTRQRLGASRRLDDARSVDDRLFEPGACMEFPPTSGDRHLTVFLDAGHGGIDPGGVGQDENGNTVYEKDITLPVELDTMALLRAKGFTVVVSRTTDETVSRPQPDDVSGGLFTAQGVHDDVAARDECADEAKADLLVGIYFDAGAYSSNAGSVTGYDSARPFSAENEKFANLLQNDVLSAMNATGLADPEPRGRRRQRAGRARVDRGGRGLRAPAAPRAGRTGLVQHAEHHAGRPHRAALHHGPVRGQHRGRLVGAARHRRRDGPGGRAVFRPAAGRPELGKRQTDAPPFKCEEGGVTRRSRVG